LEFINTVLGTPLGYIVFLAYRLTENYGLAILIFAVIVRLAVLFPINIIAHKNSIRLLSLQPGLSIIKRRYAGDKEQLNEAQYNLFKEERYSPFVGLIPLFAQLFLIIGIMQVVLNPMRHMHGINVNDIDFAFLGLDLLKIPSFANPSPELIMPLFSVGSALCFCLIQNGISPGALSQSKGTNLGMTLFTVALSLYLTLVLPVGVGLYWTTSNIVGIGVILLLNMMYDPKKLAPEALVYLDANRKTPEELKSERERKKQLKAREKQDVTRFVAAKKELVFYALTGGQYKYYKTVIEYILGNSDIVIHYLTNDPEDALFKQENPKLIPYYASQRKTISLMLKLDADIVVTTVPDLQSYHMKRSIVRERNDIEYIYLFHAPVSTTMQYTETAFDHFDTVFCIGDHHVAELRRREELTGLSQRKLIKAGYGLYDQLLEYYEALPRDSRNEKPRILIAPSWQKENLFETCIEGVLDAVLDHGYEIVVRPHPQFANLFPDRMEALIQKYSGYSETGEIVFEMEFASNDSIFTSDVLITDWSGIAYEFSYCTSRPCIFINTPQKIMNPNYKKYRIEPMELTIRNKVGVSIDPEDIKNKLGSTIRMLLDGEGLPKKQIEETLQQYLFYPGRSGEAGGKYIISRLESKGIAGQARNDGD